jgi:alpha-L-fucosidase
MTFKPTIPSLLDYRCPDWFRDAKFGIYVHWGPYSVAEHGEWYPRKMYIEGHPDYLHHLRHFGHPSEHGYKDLIPRWKAEKWNPDASLDLFRRAGARYFTPCALHHDNFDLWNSRHHRWNSLNFGPKRDITGEWRRATLDAGLRFGVTTHASRTWSWLQTSKRADRSGPKRGVPYDGNDPEYRDLYLDPSPDSDFRAPHNAPGHWRTHWVARIKDLIDNYHPDHLYFDAAVPFLGEDNAASGLDVIAHLYNHSLATHDGDQQAVMCIKNVPNHGIYIDGVCTLDMELTRLDRIHPTPWQTDTSIGPWGYRAGSKYRPVTNLIHELIDIVSSNGNVLLNVPPRADGTLDAETVRILEQIGRWLDVNGDGIYGTRPWLTSGDGDVRFTRKADCVYVHFLSSPEDGLLCVPQLGWCRGVSEATEVALLGNDAPLRWGQSHEDCPQYSFLDAQLRVVLPEKKPCDHAWTLRVRF